ncbi:uncharacterized protein J3D65DRAFT_417042 [Phyllosticta citribraziliensis]|uniref:Ankyrin repeat protein n=1 Tax=Phyllosticta citribraziliensis TaxID=989973 RepID=A0ABR1LNW1_9PEZI
MARAASKHSRSKLKIFLRHAPSLDIEVGQLSAASKSLVGNWLNLKSQGDQEPWDPFYLDTITSILEYESAYGQATSVRSLLHHGADPFRTHRSPYHDRRLEDQNFDSWTYAAMSGSTESFAQLLEWCTPRVSYEKLRDVINRSARDCLRMDFRFRTRTPHENELNMLRYLVDIGADMGQICNHGRTLLHRIMLPEEASILLDASEYSINHQDDFGWTMTMSLATAMDTDASTMLQAIRKAVSKGASLGIPDKCGKTAIHHLLDLLNGSVVMRGRLNPTFTNPIIARKSILKAALLLHMGAEMSQADACTCHCCPDGCSIFRRFLYNNIPIEDLSGGYRGHRIRGCHSYAEEFHALPWHIELFLLLRQLGCAIDEHELAKVIYRLSAFEALEMTHTCCGDNFADIERTKSPGSSLSVAELRNRCSAQQPDLADVERDMKEVEEEEHELAVQLEWKCVEFSQCVENHQKDTWIQILAQRALAREDVAKSVIKPAQGWFSDSSSRLQRLKEEKNIVIISESIPLWIPTPHETYSHTCTYIPLRYLPDPVDPIRPFRLEIYLDAYMDTCGHDYEGLAELLPDAESRRQLARERKEVVDKFLNEIQRLRKTPPKERKWANIFEEVEEQHVKFDF